MNCPSCKTEMKPLFTGWFCPKDCDRPGARASAVGERVPFDFRGQRWVAIPVTEIKPGELWWSISKREPSLRENLERAEKHGTQYNMATGISPGLKWNLPTNKPKEPEEAELYRLERLP